MTYPQANSVWGSPSRKERGGYKLCPHGCRMQAQMGTDGRIYYECRKHGFKMRTRV